MQSTPPPDPVEIVTQDCVLLGSDDVIEEVAQHTVTKALMTAKYDCVGDRLTYGNELGIALLKSYEEERGSRKGHTTKLIRCSTRFRRWKKAFAR